MSKLRRRQQGCSVCNAKPAPYRLTEQVGKTIRNKGRVCKKCIEEWMAVQQAEERNVQALSKAAEAEAKRGAEAAREVSLIPYETDPRCTNPGQNTVRIGSPTDWPRSDVVRIT